jgi:hypothetical protein
MKAIDSKVMEQFEEVAVEGATHIKKFFNYEGDNPRMFQRARVGASSISSYARIRQAEVARMRLAAGDSGQ